MLKSSMDMNIWEIQEGGYYIVVKLLDAVNSLVVKCTIWLLVIWISWVCYMQFAKFLE